MATQTIRPSLVNNCRPQQYIGRRTGKVINITARKNEHGFENVDDYFPDSDSESEIIVKNQTASTKTRDSVPTSSHAVSRSTSITSHHLARKNDDLNSNNHLSKSPSQDSVDGDSSPDSAFGSTKDEVCASSKVNGGITEVSSLARVSSQLNDGEQDAIDKDGDMAPSHSSHSPLSKDNGMEARLSFLEEDDGSPERSEMHSTKKRLLFSPDQGRKAKDCLVVIEQLSAKNCKKVDQNLDVEEDEYMIVEQPESNTSKTTSLKKGKTSKKRGPVKSRNRPGIESDDEVAIEDVCKSSETFLTLKKGGNAGTRSKMVSNNTFKNDSLLSTKQRVPRSFKKSKIPVREKKGRATVSHPREPRMKKTKPAEVTERRKSSQKGYDEETYQALGVQATMNQTEFVRFNRAGDDKLSDDFVVEQEGDEEMSAESGVEANERKGGKDSEGLSGGNKKKGLTQVSNAGSKCRKMAVRRRSQQSMTGISVAKKQAKVTSEVNNGFKLKPRAVQHKPLVKRKASTAKTRAQRNTRQNENNVGSSSELSGETGPIKAVEITVENDGKVCDDTLRSFVGERMLEPETFSVEENSNLTIKAPKGRAKKRSLETSSTRSAKDNLSTAPHEKAPRRSQRNRVPVLQYWKNERIEYERRKSGWVVKDVIVNPTPKINTRRRKMTTKPATSRAKKGTRANVSDNLGGQDLELSRRNVPEELEEEVDPTGVVINPNTMKEVKMKLLHSSRMLDFRSPVPVDGKDGDGDPAPLLVDKYFDHGQFGGGEVILRPGKEKGRQHVRSDTMVFFIVSGRVLVTVHNTSFVLAKGSTFFVPEGNVYNLINLDTDRDAHLFFTQIKG